MVPFGGNISSKTRKERQLEHSNTPGVYKKYLRTCHFHQEPPNFCNTVAIFSYFGVQFYCSSIRWGQ